MRKAARSAYFMISKEQVKHIAYLARIELSEKEVEKYQSQLAEILNYFEKLKHLKTENVETADGGTRDLYNVWREDKQEITKSNKQEAKELIEMAPEVKDEQIKVKKVF